MLIIILLGVCITAGYRERETDRETDRQTDRRTDGQRQITDTDRQRKRDRDRESRALLTSV